MNKKTLTVKDLKEKLNEFPDHYEIIVEGHDDYCEARDAVKQSWEEGTEVIIISRGKDLSDLE